MASTVKEINDIFYGLPRFEQVFKKMQDQAILIRSDNTIAVYDIWKWKVKESQKERIMQGNGTQQQTHFRDCVVLGTTH
ncbi:MAG: hypothetical protein EZS28_055953 [Streblomastix strix]|uniref:Uncharacterized protein n=1 Tax=Streblomastix strix TaxID=222440 RepID=A0A5J4PS28_9EUKA|nr:MAG: hypothetical protein EZS28_055953 [Streblomastix strix]